MKNKNDNSPVDPNCDPRLLRSPPVNIEELGKIAESNGILGVLAREYLRCEGMVRSSDPTEPGGFLKNIIKVLNSDNS